MILRALTVRQPFASAIAIGPKRVENRPRSTISSRTLVECEGWVGLHAGFDWYAGRTDDLRKLWPSMPTDDAAFVRGALLGVMHIDRVVADLEETRKLVEHGSQVPVRAAQIARDPWAFGPVCYGIDRVVLLDKPIPCRGQLGCWTVPEPHQSALLRLISR
jgi:hypothetical protein